MPVERKRIRLDRGRRCGCGLFFLTFCTAHRHPTFVCAESAEWLVRRLHELAARHWFQLHAWCLMPDHLHILIRGTAETCDMIRFAARFKQMTAFEGKRLFKRTIWQAHSYDHVVGPGDSAECIASYIWRNPVRKGLCRDPRDYPYSGSDSVDWKRTLLPSQQWTPPWKANVSVRNNGGVKGAVASSKPKMAV